MQNTFAKDQSFGEDDAIRELYDKLRPGEKANPEGARNYLASRLFEVRRYDLASVGRYKVNKKLDVVQRAIGNKLANDLVNKYTGEVIVPAGTEIDAKWAKVLEENREHFRITKEYELMLEGNSVVLECLDVYVRGQENKQVVHLIGNDQREERLHVVLSDIFASITF